MTNPLTPEELQAMRSEAANARDARMFSAWASAYSLDMPRLLDEVERLQRANTALAAQLQSYANPSAWTEDRRFVRGFREPWVYAEDALSRAGIVEREPQHTIG